MPFSVSWATLIEEADDAVENRRRPTPEEIDEARHALRATEQLVDHYAALARDD